MRPIAALPEKSLQGMMPAVEFGPAAQLQWLPVERLVVDESYQREIRGAGIANIRSIAGCFEWCKFAPVIVSPIAGGLFAIVDGAHRTTAAASCGIKEVPCQVVIADQKQQAACFDALNGATTHLSSLHRFKARLLAGDALALRADKVANSAGVKLIMGTTANSRLGPNETAAFTIIEKIIQRYGEAFAVTVLRCVISASAGRYGFLTVPIIKAVADVLADHKEWAANEALIEAFAGFQLVGAKTHAAAQAAVDRRLSASLLLQAAIIERLSWKLDGRPAKPALLEKKRAS
jgi:hypothetical protein